MTSHWMTLELCMPEVVTYREALLPLEVLVLDPNNYRFQDEPGFVLAEGDRFAELAVQERAFKRVLSEGVSELKNSILTNGFLSVERLVVRPYEGNTYLVIEGNRRLAALKSIAADREAGVALPEGLEDVLQNVPVIIVEGDASEVTYLSIMGIRHVGGIKEWAGYQRAKVIATLRDQHSLEPGEIASRLGLTVHEVNRRYRAFKALEQMRGDDEFGEHVQAHMYPLFHEAISIAAVKDWLGWNDAESKFTDRDALQTFYALITPSEVIDMEQDEVRPPKLGTYLQVRELRHILGNAEAKQVLLNEDRTFGEALGIAKADELSRSWRSQIAEAITALSTISALELARLEGDDFAIVDKVAAVAAEVIETYKKLHPDS